MRTAKYSCFSFVNFNHRRQHEIFYVHKFCWAIFWEKLQSDFINVMEFTLNLLSHFIWETVYEMHTYISVLQQFTKYMDDAKPGEEYHILLVHNREILCYDPIRIFLKELYPYVTRVNFAFDRNLAAMYRYEWLRFQITDPEQDAAKIALLSGEAFWAEFDKKYAPTWKETYFPYTVLNDDTTILLTDAQEFFKNKLWYTWNDLINETNIYKIGPNITYKLPIAFREFGENLKNTNSEPDEPT